MDRNIYFCGVYDVSLVLNSDDLDFRKVHKNSALLVPSSMDGVSESGSQMIDSKRKQA